jgi:hypothetical protein
MELAGTSIDNFENTVNTELKEVERESNSAAKAIETMSTKMQAGLATAIGAVEKF